MKVDRQIDMARETRGLINLGSKDGYKAEKIKINKSLYLTVEVFSTVVLIRGLQPFPRDSNNKDFGD